MGWRDGSMEVFVKYSGNGTDEYPPCWGYSDRVRGDIDKTISSKRFECGQFLAEVLVEVYREIAFHFCEGESAVAEDSVDH